MGKKGLTFMEIMVVMIIIGILSVLVLPNFTTPSEKARSQAAQNNLLAIYTAEHNYAANNNGNYCWSNANCGDTITNLNTNLSLSITDDGSYTYACATSTACTATRNNGSGFSMTINLAAPVQLTGAVNPTCSSANWCPD